MHTDATSPTLQLTRLNPRAIVPSYQTAGAAGLDIAACLETDETTITLEPGARTAVPTGLAVAIPQGFEGQVRARSGLSTKHGIGLPNAPGTIDCDYRGELRIALINWSSEPYTIRHGARIAQLVIAPVVQVRVEEVDQLDTTARGAGGFGSTGGH